MGIKRVIFTAVMLLAPLSSVAEIDFEALGRRVKANEQARQEEQAAKTAQLGWRAWLPGNTKEECIIDQMPGAQNDVVARTIATECAKLPERAGPFTTSGPFGTKTAARCVLKNGADIRTTLGARILYNACHRTYPEE